MIDRITLALLTGLVAAALPAQEPPPKPKPEAAQKVKKLEEWPAIDARTERRVPAILGQLRKDDEKLRAKALQSLVSLGSPAAPLLLRRLTDNPVNFNDEIISVLDQVVGPEHAALLARDARTRKVALRRYVLRRLAEFADPDMKPVLKHAAKDTDTDVAFFGALGLAAHGDVDALPAVFARCRDDWGEWNGLVAEVLPHGRGRKPAKWLVEHIGKGLTADKITGLRLLRYLAPREYAGIIAVHLDAEQNAVKKEAINALRVVVDGAEPLENLSVFQAIEMAKKWKARV